MNVKEEKSVSTCNASNNTFRKIYFLKRKSVLTAKNSQAKNNLVQCHTQIVSQCL